MTWTTGQSNQAFYGWMNYGSAGTGGVDGSGDITDMWTRLTAEMTAQGTAAQQNEGGQQARRFYFDHMRARIVLTNTGTAPIFWEIYECTARKDIPLTEANTMEGFFQACQGNVLQGSLSASGGGAASTAYQTSATSQPQRTVAGVTPFQFRHFCQNWKIGKVTRLQAAPGNTVSFDASSPRNICVNFDDYAQLLAKRGITKLFLVRQWGAVTGSPPNNSASAACCEVEKDYNVKVIDQTNPQLNYITYTNTTET